MTSPFPLAGAGSKRAYGPKPRQQSNIWGVVEATLCQRRKRKKEGAEAQNGVFNRASEMARLTLAALEFPFEVICFLHSCHATPLTPPSPTSLCSHRIVE